MGTLIGDSESRLAVASDAHDSLESISKVVGLCSRLDVRVCLWLGDLTSPPSAKSLMGFDYVHGIIGNNDGDVGTLVSTFIEHNSRMVPRPFDSITIGNRRVFLTHYPELAAHAFESSRYDAVFYGHDHKASYYSQGNRIMANPGALWSQGNSHPSFGVWNLMDNEFIHYDLTGDKLDLV